jgi:CubicO group peptidase (beta-lactamase class C family)
VQTVLDPAAADLRVGKGTFGWAGGTGVNVNIDPQEQMVTLFMVQTLPGRCREISRTRYGKRL